MAEKSHSNESKFKIKKRQFQLLQMRRNNSGSMRKQGITTAPKNHACSLAMASNQSKHSEMRGKEFKIWIVGKLKKIQDKVENHHKRTEK